MGGSLVKGGRSAPYEPAVQDDSVNPGTTRIIAVEMMPKTDGERKTGWRSVMLVGAWVAMLSKFASPNLLQDTPQMSEWSSQKLGKAATASRAKL